MAGPQHYDVAILGAGQAGLFLARQLLLYSDKTILLLDPAPELPGPRQKLGESTVQIAGFYMSKVLDLEEYLLREHFLKYNLRFYWKSTGHLSQFRFDPEVAGEQRKPPDSALELADLTLTDMFLPDRSGESRIASYEGRSSLATWLWVIVSNRTINERQRMWNRMQRVELSVDIADATALRSVEIRTAERSLRARAQRFFAVGLLGLGRPGRLILLWRYEEGLQLGEIARLLGVHQSTVTGQLERLLKRMRGEVVSILASKYQLSLAAIEECLSVIVDRPSHSISVFGLIRQTAAGEKQQAVEMPASWRNVAPARGTCSPGARTASLGETIVKGDWTQVEISDCRKTGERAGWADPFGF
jgi:RNA polymerase sigma factor (sigma-70 family)